MATTTIQANIELNAKQATDQVDKFGNAVEGADKSVENLNKDLQQTAKQGDNLESSLKNQEARLKTLDGTINIVGGSIEVLAGGLVALGIASEEDAKKFESFALSAIALADGTKRIFDGYKSLTEARVAYTDITRESTAVENANTAAIESNAATAGILTGANSNAATSINAEAGATRNATIAKGENTIATTENTLATYAGIDSKIREFAVVNKTTEARAASILGYDIETAKMVEGRLVRVSTNAAIEAETVARQKLTVVQRIELFLTNAINAAQKISLLGWAGIIVAIGAAVAAIYNWTKGTKEANEELVNFNELLVENVRLNKQQIESLASQTTRLRLLTNVVTDNTKKQEDRIKALKELQKLVPELVGLDLRQADAIDKITLAVGREIAAIERRAKAKAIEQKVTEAYARQLELIQEVQDEFAKQGFQISENEARLALLRQDQVGQTKILAEEYQSLNNQIGIATDSLIIYVDELLAGNSAASSNITLTNQQTSALERYQRALINIAARQKKLNQELNEEIMLSFGGRVEQQAGVIQKQLRTVEGEAKMSAATLQDYFNDAITKQINFFESNLGEAASSTLQIATSLARTLSENIDESNEEGFEKGKKYRIAETRVASIQAAFEAYKGLIGVPYVGQALAIAASAAALLAGQKAINDIKDSTFGDTNTPSNPVSATPISQRGINPAFNPGRFLGSQGTPTTIQAQDPIQAYVLASDVTTGLQAYGSINRRRRFG